MREKRLDNICRYRSSEVANVAQRNESSYIDHATTLQNVSFHIRTKRSSERRKKHFSFHKCLRIYTVQSHVIYYRGRIQNKHSLESHALFAHVEQVSKRFAIYICNEVRRCYGANSVQIFRLHNYGRFARFREFDLSVRVIHWLELCSANVARQKGKGTLDARNPAKKNAIHLLVKNCCMLPDK